MWRAAATELGAAVERLSPVVLEFRLGSATTHVMHRMTTPLTDRVGYELAGDKPLAYRLLAASDVPVPDHIVVPVGDLAGARSFRREVGSPLLTKPCRGSGGGGVVGQIETPSQLAEGLRCAWTIDSAALVERHRPGDTFRLLFLDGELLDVLRRTAPSVSGDGRSTIEELVRRENDARVTAGGDAAGLKPLPLDLDLMNTLHRSGRRLTSVPDAGEQIILRSAANFGGRPQRARADVCEAVIETGRRSAAALGLRLAGVDVLTTDAMLPLAETGGVTLEVNPLPGLSQHDLATGEPVSTRPSVAVLARLLGIG